MEYLGLIGVCKYTESREKCEGSRQKPHYLVGNGYMDTRSGTYTPTVLVCDTCERLYLCTALSPRNLKGSTVNDGSMDWHYYLLSAGEATLAVAIGDASILEKQLPEGSWNISS